MKYTLERTKDGDLEVKVTEGTGWLLYVVQGGSGLDIKKLEMGESWREGRTEEYENIFESEEEARKALQK